MTSASVLPSPLNSPDCVLHGMPCMLVNVGHVRDSTLELEALGLALRAQAASWHQEPAGSLPSNERHLARALGFGTDARSLRRLIREGALRDWVLCSDGRLYHSEVCAKAQAARAARLRQVAQTEAARTARHAEAPQAPPAESTQPAAPPVPDDVPPIISQSTADDRPVIDASSGDDLDQVVEIVEAPSSVTEPVTGSYLTKVLEAESSLRDASQPPPSDKGLLFREGVSLLREMTDADHSRTDERGHQKRVRSLIGKLLQLLDDDAVSALAIIRQAHQRGLADSVEWIMKAAHKHVAAKRERPHRVSDVRQKWGLDRYPTNLNPPDALAAVRAALGR